MSELDRHKSNRQWSHWGRRSESRPRTVQRQAGGRPPDPGREWGMTAFRKGRPIPHPERSVTWRGIVGLLLAPALEPALSWPCVG
jgi:hypothetical protein